MDYLLLYASGVLAFGALTVLRPFDWLTLLAAFLLGIAFLLLLEAQFERQEAENQAWWRERLNGTLFCKGTMTAAELADAIWSEIVSHPEPAEMEMHAFVDKEIDAIKQASVNDEIALKAAEVMLEERIVRNLHAALNPAAQRDVYQG